MEHRITNVEQGIVKLEGSIGDINARLDRELVDVKTRLAVAETNIRDIREDLTSIKANTTWILRIVVGAVIAALLALVLNGGGV